MVFANNSYPFYLNKNGTVLMGEVDAYLSNDLYNNNKLFLKTLTKQVKFQLIQMRYVISGAS